MCTIKKCNGGNFPGTCKVQGSAYYYMICTTAVFVQARFHYMMHLFVNVLCLHAIFFYLRVLAFGFHLG